MGLLAVIWANLFAAMIAVFTFIAPAALLIGGLAVAGLCALFGRKSRLTGTTLVAPWWWSLVALAAVALSEFAIAIAAGTHRAEWVMPLRFAAAMATFCPLMALLGAKRPQDRAWQFIVFSLWIVLSMPSFEWLLFGGVEEIHLARFWFLVVLTLIGATNGLTTRYWLSGLLFAIGQLALLAPFLTSTQAPLSGDFTGPLGLSAMVLAWVLVALGFPPARRASNPLDRVWRDFRDLYGVVWALRIAERVNASATMYSWPVRLDWRGFHDRETDQPVADVPEAVVESLRSLLRRFMSPEWIAARLDGPPGAGSPDDARTNARV